MEIDEDQFTGGGAFLFACVLERFFGMSASLNSFTQLRVTTPQRREGLHEWEPRSGRKLIIVRPIRSLGQQLVEDACSFEFFQAVALLQRLRAIRPVGGFSSPEDEAVRFPCQSATCVFPPAKSRGWKWPATPAEMTVNFMGLTGPMGVLPYAYSELILEQGPGQRP